MYAVPPAPPCSISPCVIDRDVWLGVQQSPNQKSAGQLSLRRSLCLGRLVSVYAMGGATVVVAARRMLMLLGSSQDQARHGSRMYVYPYVRRSCAYPKECMHGMAAGSTRCLAQHSFPAAHSCRMHEFMGGNQPHPSRPPNWAAQASQHSAAAQNARPVKSATPRLIQWPCGLSDVSSTYMTKLVEWPVVDSVPARVSVLYTGQS